MLTLLSVLAANFLCWLYFSGRGTVVGLRWGVLQLVVYQLGRLQVGSMMVSPLSVVLGGSGGWLGMCRVVYMHRLLGGMLVGVLAMRGRGVAGWLPGGQVGRGASSGGGSRGPQQLCEWSRRPLVECEGGRLRLVGLG